MKNLFILFFGVVVLCSFQNGIAQEKTKTKIGLVKQKGDLVSFMVTGSRPFIMGGNEYILHIGDKEFSRYEQYKNSGKGRLTFLIDAGEYKTLSDGAGIYLSYGHVAEDEAQDMEALSKEQFVPCWSLGKFSKKFLVK